VRSFFWGWIPATCTAGGRERRGSDVGSHGQCAQEHARCLPWVGRESRGPLAHTSRSRHLRAGHGAGAFVGTGHGGGRPPTARPSWHCCWLVDCIPSLSATAWYACAPFLARLATSRLLACCGSKVIASFYRPAPTRLAGQVGASRKDGGPLSCKDESSHGEADETWEGLDAKGARIEVAGWNHLHLRTARWWEVSPVC